MNASSSMHSRLAVRQELGSDVGSASITPIDPTRRSAAEGRVGSIGVIEADPTSDPSSCLTASLECIEEDAFIFQRSPQPLDEDIVHPAAPMTHRLEHLSRR